MAANEKTIRDKLAQHLELLEPGLQLIEMEYPLPNLQGAKGFIDILVKDVFGNRVIIELKRSNQTARQTVHEILKYLALFRNKEGLPYGKIRCFVVSTEWHELKVPFAEFIRVAKCQCEGFELSVDDEGNVLDATKHKLVTLAEPLCLFRQHSVFLFIASSARDQAIDTVVNTFKTIGGEGCFSVVMDYDGSSPAVIYRHAVYFVPSAVRMELLAELAESAREETGYTNEEADEIRSSVEDRFAEKLVESAAHIWDDLEIGYPEKFNTLLLKNWKIARIVRWGNVPTTAAADDDEVARMIAGTEGQNTTHFYHLTSPRFEIQWKEIRDNGHGCLFGNEAWTRGFDWFCELLESDYCAADVSFAIYNPMHLPMSFFQLIARNDPAYFPSFQIVAIDSNKQSLCGLVGRIEWDGDTKPASLEEVFSPDFCDLEAFFVSEVVHEGWKLDAELMRRHGLYYALSRADEKADSFEASPVVVSSEACLLKCMVRNEHGKTIDDFIKANQDYLVELIHWLEAYLIEP